MEKVNEITKENDFHMSNKLAVINVLAGLINNPLLFGDNSYNFSIEDFPEAFHKIIFAAIQHLSVKGMKKIDYIDIDQFLKQYPLQYKLFTENNGISYIQNCLKLFDQDKFDYYYNTLKKYSLLNSLESQGINTQDIYNPSLLDPKENIKMQTAFDALSVNDILEKEETKIILAKEKYASTSDRVENGIGDNVEDLIDELKKTPIMGLPLPSAKLTTLYRGLRKGCVYMTSAASGAGKTRFLVGQAVNLAIPEYYDTIKKKWVKTNLSENVLLIETELELAEIQTMVLANISGVPETNILDGRFAEGEEDRVRKAAKLMKKSKLFLVAITNYDSDDLINIIRKYHQLYKVDYVFYDYLSENIKILAEGTKKTKVSNLRTDQILLSMITSLKDCAKLLNIHISTATQLSGDFKNAKELDASYLRSAKSLSDKLDVGAILMYKRDIDQAAIDSYCAKGFEVEPDFVLSVYKIRRGSYQNIKVYLKFDRATCRVVDTFVTDSKGVMIPIADTNIEVILDSTSEDNFENILQEFDY